MAHTGATPDKDRSTFLVGHAIGFRFRELELVVETQSGGRKCNAQSCGFVKRDAFRDSAEVLAVYSDKLGVGTMPRTERSTVNPTGDLFTSAEAS
jgi:hypothetical protein